MTTSDQNNDTTVPKRQSQPPAEPTTPKGVDPIERENVEIPLPPSDTPNLEIEEDVIEEVAREADVVEVPVRLNHEEKGSVPPRGRSMTPPMRPRRQAELSEKMFHEVRNPLPEQIYPASPSKPHLFLESNPWDNRLQNPPSIREVP